MCGEIVDGKLKRGKSELRWAQGLDPLAHVLEHLFGVVIGQGGRWLSDRGMGLKSEFAVLGVVPVSSPICWP
jgi:hypothetical protein